MESLAILPLVALAVGVNIGFLIGYRAVSCGSPRNIVSSPFSDGERPLLQSSETKHVNPEDVEIAHQNHYVQSRAQ